MTLKDDYPWKNASMDSYDQWGMGYRQCVSFTAFRLVNRNGYNFQRHGFSWNANEWKRNAQNLGITVDKNPVRGSIAWTSAGGYGHVAWVYEVKGNNVTVEEYNYSYDGRYHYRTVNKNSFENYIHFKDLPTHVYNKIISKKNVSLGKLFDQSNRNDGIYAAGPWNTGPNVVKVDSGKNYHNKIVSVTQEAVTDNNVTWYYVNHNGKNLGWVDSRAFQAKVYSTIVSKKNLSVGKRFNQSSRNDGIYANGPWNTGPSVTNTRMGKDFHGQMAQVTQEVVTDYYGQKVTWYHIKINGKNLGWIDTAAFDTKNYNTVVSQKAIFVGKKFNQSTRNDGIYANGPWNTGPNVVNVGTGKNFHGQIAQVTQEAVTDCLGQKVTWYSIKIDGKELGWIDSLAFDTKNYNTIVNQNDIILTQKIDQSTRNDGIYANGPWNTGPSVANIGVGKDFHGQIALITKEAITDCLGQRVKWYYFSINGKDIGWIDSLAFGSHVYSTITSLVETNLTKQINQNERNDGIYANGPWNTTLNAINVGTAKTYNGKTAQISKEAITDLKGVNVTWYYTTVEDKELGWIDAEAFE
ncbi:GW dipeptide domain-containing protein [Enterococcus quebecensis]|uniref:Peptidase C51 domain-containing protein n=1 Tax=Enterococcus quebecensis TaxID=903983 RepID=A0A1E5GTH7_9ENTE|nr:GW dipeptide domain-containing protein [Enterococcus quebecensis]OEG15994.1 hypothetical protein BCR23_07555 [Enterococcus quebecensis]OJG74970.1 hypothetical protein RV12_GL002015 [Enterococcus quebecensis]